MRKIVLPFIVLISLLTSVVFSQTPTKLLRFPAIYENQIVFTYAGNLYTVPANGGTARQLTSHDGYEMFARFSPDGQTIAFTGQYDGNTEVFVMPAEGGAPERLTYTATLHRDDVSDRMGPNNLVMGWTVDGKKIIFRSRMHEFNSFKGQLYTVGLKGEVPEQLPFSHGGFCSFAPDGNKFAYNSVFREFRTWKRYRGGMADDIRIFDFDTKKTVKITNNDAQDIYPMWKGDKIYYLSDRDANKRMNLFCYDTNTEETRKLTDYVDFDIKFASLGKNAIVFEYGGEIYRFDLATEEPKKIEITVIGDKLGQRMVFKDLSKSIRHWSPSPDGKRALFGARGEIFTAPVKHGVTRNLTKTSGVHERNCTWSPDGKWIAYISDKTGEGEIFIVAQDGKTPEKQITSDATTYKYSLVWSPDSKKILWGDKELRLRYVDINTRKIKNVAKTTTWEFRDYAWSPDSKWIAYTQAESESQSIIYLYSTDKKENYPVTEGWYSARNPRFSDDGTYLLFVSDRDFQPIYSSTEWNHAYGDQAKIYLATLAKDTKSPFQPENDEVTIGTAKEEDKEEKAEEKIDIKIDVDNISQRIISLPVAVSNYFNLTTAEGGLYYLRRGRNDKKMAFLWFDFKKQKETDLGTIGGYSICANKKKMMVANSGKFAIVDLPKAKVEIKDAIDVSGLTMMLDRPAEWQQIFTEAWRQMRDFFYAPNMHGLDWKAVHDKYQPLVQYVNHRNDLTYIMGEMVGELNVGHAYVGGGDRVHPKRIKTGLLGADVKRDQSGYYKITQILDGENWDKNLRSPLTEIGVNVNEGDYILAVNGVSTREMKNIFSAFINTAGHQVILTVNEHPETDGSHEEIIIPVDNEQSLYYHKWVQANINKVSDATDDKVGYIHIPDMLSSGLNEFAKQYYPQLKKKALIIDVRGNGGGNVSPMIIERLRREIVMIDVARNTAPTTDPNEILWGPTVCLINEYSASDGDLFPYRYKTLKMGELIGKRTWGGVVGIRGSLPFLDGGTMHKPEYSRYDLAGKTWAIEGHGVDPTIEVENDPHDVFNGKDAQLNRAISEILDDLKTHENTIPAMPAYPVK